MKKHILEEKIILDIKISDDKEFVKFITNEGDIICYTEADCCSDTWVESIELPAGGFPAKILKAEDVNMPDLGELPYCDVVSYYGFKIITDKGDILIDYRNDSNGYYGGWLSWDDQNISTKNWKNIKE